jgi:hypothetical protein
MFPAVYVIAAILNTPISVSTRSYLFPGTFGSDGLSFSGIKQFGRPVVTLYGIVIAVLTGRSRDNQLVLVGYYSYQVRNMPIEVFIPHIAETGCKSDNHLPSIVNFLERTWPTDISFTVTIFGTKLSELRVTRLYTKQPILYDLSEAEDTGISPAMTDTPSIKQQKRLTPGRVAKQSTSSNLSALGTPSSAAKLYIPVAERIKIANPFEQLYKKAENISSTVILISLLYTRYTEAQIRVINMADVQSQTIVYITFLQ